MAQTAQMNTSAHADDSLGDWLSALPHEDQGLRLRQLRVDDLDAFLGWRSDPEVARFQGWELMDADAARAFLQAQVDSGPQAVGTWRQIGVADAASDRLLGDVGVWLFPHAREAEFGISVAREAQGRGVGRWAISTLCGLLFTQGGVVRIRAAADVRNLPSLRMLAAAGMRPCGERDVVSKGEACRERLFERVRDHGQACDTEHPSRSAGAPP